MSDIRRVGVVGCGIMGSGIAEVCAGSGLDVLVAVSTEASMAAGQQRLLESLDRSVRKGTLTEVARGTTLNRISFTTDLRELADRQLVVEAVREHEPTKLEVFAALAKVIEDPDAILASNTSSIPIIKLAQATGRADHVVGMHFFSPAPVLPLVELIGSSLADEQTCARVESFVTEVLGKQVIWSPDRTGFLVNALLIPYLLSAIRMVESGFASAEVIDKGMVLGCSHPLGPLKLADVIGLDTIASVAAALYEEFSQPQYSPPPLLLRMVEDGRLGKKTGRGFHEYP